MMVRVRKVKSAFSSYRHIGPVGQPGMPIDGAEERPVCMIREPRNRKVAGPNPARSTTNLERALFSDDNCGERKRTIRSHLQGSSFRRVAIWDYSALISCCAYARSRSSDLL